MANLSAFIGSTNAIVSSISDGDTTHAPDGNSVYDALALKAPLASPTFTGTVDVSSATLTLADDQVSGSKINSYMGKNAIINGNFDIWQRGTSFSAVTNGNYTADRFVYIKSNNGVHTISRDTDVPTQAQSGLLSTYSIKIDCTTADTALDDYDYNIIYQKIEGYNFRQFVGKTATLSFWVKATKTGTYCISFRNSNADRTYVSEYSVSQSDTWEKKTITLTFNYSGGTWDYTTGVGLEVMWILNCANPFRTANVNTWQSSNYMATTNQVNACDSTNNNFWLSQVQLELGPVATDFECRPYGLELMLCQRYYRKLDINGTYNLFGIMRDATHADSLLLLSGGMRAAPTITAPTSGNCFGVFYNADGVANYSGTTYGASMYSVLIRFTTTTSLTPGIAVIITFSTSSAYIDISSEL